MFKKDSNPWIQASIQGADFWNDLVIYDPCHIFSVSVTQKKSERKK